MTRSAFTSVVLSVLCAGLFAGGGASSYGARESEGNSGQGSVTTPQHLELKVQAKGSAGQAADMNSEPATLLVVVTYQGISVASLQADNFSVRQIVAPPTPPVFCPAVAVPPPPSPVVSFQPVGNGAYRFGVIRVDSCVWGAGKYLYQILVQQPLAVGTVRQGQAIADIIVP